MASLRCPAVLVVVALGGNALLRRGQPLDAETQRQNIAIAAQAIAELARDHRLVITHGNGPQVGLLALQSADSSCSPPFPLDVLGAESEGMIGYVIEQELSTRLPDQEFATLLTQVLVDRDDPAFGDPDKPIGPVYSENDARRVAAEHGWILGPDGDGYRRLVASPAPKVVRELSAIRHLVDAGILVICGGGGGIPVTIDRGGAIRGIEAVIDKDRTSALLAAELGADALLLLTDVTAVYLEWGTAEQQRIFTASPAALQRHIFAAGSMAPKIQAACEFVRKTGRPAGIGALEDAAAILRGEAGTTIRDGAFELKMYDRDGQ